MDKRLEQALEVSNFRRILETRQQHLKLLMNNKMNLSYGGGVFKINQAFLSFVDTVINNNGSSFIFIDVNDTPIVIEDLKEFGRAAWDRYVSALNQYYDSYQKLSEARDLRKVLEWDEE